MGVVIMANRVGGVREGCVVFGRVFFHQRRDNCRDAEDAEKNKRKPGPARRKREELLVFCLYYATPNSFFKYGLIEVD